MTIFLILGGVAALYLIWLLFRLAAYALPVYAGVALGLFLHAEGYGYAAAISSGLAAGGALLVAGRLVIAFSPIFRWPVVILFVVPAGFAGYQTAGGLAALALDPGAGLSILSWIGALVAASGAWTGLVGGGMDDDHPVSAVRPQEAAEPAPGAV